MFKSKTVAIITGASRGFGRTIASSFASEFSQTEEGCKSVFVLVSRSADGMKETKKIVEQICTKITVHIVCGDLADLSTLPSLVTTILHTVNTNDFSSAILVNNAGSLGDVKKNISDFENVEDIQREIQFNITSPYYLISNFLRVFASIQKYVVNVSTKAATDASPTMSLYCTTKAARDMLHQVLALESKDVRVLNYAPGPLKTEMFYDILNNSSSTEVKKMFQGMIDSGYLLEPATSSDRLVILLKQDRYTSGVHIDYFDDLP